MNIVVDLGGGIEMGKGAGRAGRKVDRGTIHDVARVSGVSIGTVSRAFNNRPDVSEETRQLVLDAARRVHYSPKSVAPRLSVGLVIEHMNQATEVGYVSSVISAIAKEVVTHGGVLELVPLDDLHRIHGRNLSGLIAMVFGRDCGPLLEIDDVPVVLINNVVESENFHTVGSDHEQGAYIAMRHLLRMGHRRIGFMEIQERNWSSCERQRGYRRALAEAGIGVEPALMRFTEHGGVGDELKEVMARLPSALLVCGEDLSLAVNRLLLHELKVEIPDELSVVSFEVPLVSEMLSPPQTAVVQPWAEIGRQAIDVLRDLAGQERPARRVQLLPNRLIDRCSVALHVP